MAGAATTGPRTAGCICDAGGIAGAGEAGMFCIMPGGIPGAIGIAGIMPGIPY